MGLYVDNHERFVTAQAIRAELKKLISDKESAIIGRLVLAYKDSKLEPIQALAGISEIHGLRSLLSTVETEYKSSLKALEKETGGRR